MRRLSIVLLAPLVLATSCAEFDELEVLRTVVEHSDDIGELGDVDPSTAGASFAGLALAGVVPAADYAQTGNVELSVVGQSLGALGTDALEVEVANGDGSYTACEPGGGDVRPAAPNNVISLMLDGSGSMEFTYPVEEYGPVCTTCPHDPGRERVGAAHRFVDQIFATSPDARVAVGEFGPTPSAGMRATVLHHDFSNEGFSILGTLEDIKGYEPLGTPLWDSLEEMVARTDDEARLVASERPGEVARHMLVLSDGRDSTSEWASLDSVIRQANAANITVYAVGLGPASASDVDPQYDDQTNTVRDLQTLTRETGGFYSSVDDPARLHELFDTVAAAVTDGWETRRVRCVPRPSGGTYDNVRPPASGTPVNGRVGVAGASLPFSFIAP
jgi:hypothetical protein